MMNKKLIADAIKIVVEYFEYEGICEETKTIKARAEEWYSYTEITDSYTLAAVTMYGSFVPGIKDSDIKQIKESFFPSTPIEYIHFNIQEIEAALDDLKMI